MGFDNECILNIQSLPGEHFCPVCRTLVYPNEALQAQCTHLYCKPCLAYVVATTRACPYDGYLVTEADSKPLMESNKALAETIGKVSVHCLYHRSGCQWEGGLSDCITHCAECSFGNSPVICNRCGTQIMHRQVQEHGQTCPGVQNQAQQVEGQAQDPKAQGQAAAHDQPSTASAAPAPTSATSTASAAVPVSVPATTAATTGTVMPQGSTAAYPQAVTQTPTPEQWYQQQQLQYQQYYQQYQGYYPYQQQYQQYAQYQQQAYPQYGQPQMQVAPQQVIPGQQPQPYMVPQPYPQHQSQPQPQPQPQPPPQPQLQPQPQPQAQPVPQPQTPAQLVPQPQTQVQTVPQPQLQAQPVPQLQQQGQVQQLQPQQQHPPQLQPQAPIQPQSQSHVQHPLQPQQLPVPAQQPHQHAPLQTHPLPHALLSGQQMLQPQHSQPQPHQVQPQQFQAPPQHQQHVTPQHPHSQIQHIQPHLQQQSYPQHQPQLRPQPHPQPQLQQLPNQLQPHLMPQPHSFAQPQPQHPLAHAVTGHQSYPQPQPQQQIPTTAPQQRPMQVPPPQPHSQHPVQSQSQFPPQQAPHIRSSHASQLQMQVQQQPVMMPPQGPHANVHPAQHPVQQQGQQFHQHPAMQPRAQQPGQLHPGQSHMQAVFPSQHAAHPQQALHPQGHVNRQQQIPVQQHMQHNAIAAMPGHQAQPASSRPMMPPQQPFHQSTSATATAVQAGLNQQSPKARATLRPASSTELQPGSILQNQLAQNGSQGGLISVSPASNSRTESNNAHIEMPESDELKAHKSENDLKLVDNEGSAAPGASEKDVQLNTGRKDDSHSVEVHEAGLESRGKDENVEEPVAKLHKKEETSEHTTDGIENSEVPKGETVELSREKVEQKDSNKLPDGTGTQVESSRPASTDSKANQWFATQGQISGITGNNMQTPPQHISQQQSQQHAFLAQGGLDRSQDIPPKGPIPGQERYPIQPNLEGHPPRMLDPAISSQRPPPAHQNPERMVFPEHVTHSGLSQWRRLPDPALHQAPVPGQPLAPRPPVQNFPETLQPQGLPPVLSEPFQMPVGKQPHDTWHPEAPHAHLLGSEPPTSSVRGPPPFGHAPKGFEEQAIAPSGQNINYMPRSHDGGPRNFLGEPFGRQFNSGPPTGPRGPPFGIEGQIGMVPPNPVEVEGYARKSGLEGRQLTHPTAPAEHVPFGQTPVGRSSTMVMNGGAHDSAFPHGLPKERLGPLPAERFKPFPVERFNAPDERFRTSGPDTGTHIRKDFEEDLKRFPRPAHLDDGYTNPSRPPFGSSRPLDRVPYGADGDPNSMTSRPLPGGSFPSNSGGLALHPMDIGGRPMRSGPHEDTGRRNDTIPVCIDHRMDSLPPFKSPGREYGLSTGRYGAGGHSNTQDFNGRELRGLGEHTNPFNLPPGDSFGGGLHDGKIPGPPSPGYFHRGDHDVPGNARMIGQKGSVIFSDPIRKDMNDPDILASRYGPVKQIGHDFSSSLRASEFSPRNPHSHLRAGESLGKGQLRMGEPTGFGGIHGHSQMGDPVGPGLLPSHFQNSEQILGNNFGGRMNTFEPGFGGGYPKHSFPGEAKSFNSVFLHGDMNSFEHSGIRKPGSMGWCRICNIDCETVEGLDLHSQTREHQKMTMDLVLTIKQENAKRLKFSEGNMLHDDTNKMRKTSFENRVK